MAWKWIEGFEVRKNTTALQQGYDVVSGTPSIVTGRLHGSGLQCPNSSQVHLTKIFSSQTTWIVGLAFKRENGGNTDGLIELLSGATADEIAVFTTAANNELMVAVGGPTGTTYVTSIGLQDDTWYFVEFKVTVNATTGSFELRVNGTTVLSQTGINTSDTGANAADRVRIYAANTGGTAGNATIDDCYILDGTGAAYNDFLGDGVAEGLLPTGAGNSSQWSKFPGSGEANWQNVDDASGPDNDSTYNHTASTGVKDTYVFADLGFITGNVLGVQLNWNARIATSGSRTLRPIVRHSGADYAGSNQNLTSTSYLQQHQVLGTNPGTGSAWTVSDINNAEFGLEAVA